MRICGVLICYHFLLNRRSSNVLSYVYWTNVCYTLIDLLACVPYYSMHVLNKHEGLSKKKKIFCAHGRADEQRCSKRSSRTLKGKICHLCNIKYKSHHWQPMQLGPPDGQFSNWHYIVVKAFENEYHIVEESS